MATDVDDLVAFLNRRQTAAALGPQSAVVVVEYDNKPGEFELIVPDKVPIDPQSWCFYTSPTNISLFIVKSQSPNRERLRLELEAVIQDAVPNIQRAGQPVNADTLQRYIYEKCQSGELTRHYDVSLVARR